MVTDRSIPACAGEPLGPTFRATPTTVYPRVCGGTRNHLRQRWVAGGLSPRVRGNRLCEPEGPHPQRSIPACAGEPLHRLRLGIWVSVYPRVCGGTLLNVWPKTFRCGLSPRVRGNRSGSSLACSETGSIPACAGEPSGCAPTPPAPRVYPRVCGGTMNTPTFTEAQGGLSPRVRGNLLPGLHPVARPRSIPACAGEPPSARASFRTEAVYPRVCGGTDGRGQTLGCDDGLSPRVRGNHLPEVLQEAVAGSIPACAGEPATWAPTMTRPAVYPRVCGGTYCGLQCGTQHRGLSPRVRGNPGARPASPADRGSIPACAGEPRTCLG